MHRYLKLALAYCKDNQFCETLDYKLCAVVVRGGAVVSVGFNKHNTNSFVEHYADKVKGHGRDFCMSTHAEQAAVLQARSKSDLSGSKIYVARLRKDARYDPIGMARPCLICEKVLQAYGIKRAYYTIDSDHYGIMKISSGNTSTDKIIRIDE